MTENRQTPKPHEPAEPMPEFFRDMMVDDLETLGVDVVEDEHSGSTHYAAKLRGDIYEANRAAEAAAIAVRLSAAAD